MSIKILVSGPSSGRSGGSRLPTLIRPLLDAATSGDLDKVKQLIASGHDINERDHGGWTPFIKACEHGHLEIAKLLQDKGADVNAASSFGWTPLMQASENGHLEVVKYLISKKADVEQCKNSDKHSALYKAVSGGHAEVCEYLVKHGANLEHVDKEGTQLLIQACYKGKLEAVKFLVSKGADLKEMRDTNYGNTPFLTACRWGHIDIVEYIASTVKDLDVSQGNTYDSSALHLAIASENLDLIKLLFKLGYKVPKTGGTPPLNGVSSVEIMKYLLDLDLPVNVFSEYGTSPLADAAYNGRLEIVKLLIAKGADPYLKNSSGENAFDYIERGKGHNNVQPILDYFATLQKN
jgi:ankyrin repeat protein